MSSSPTTATIDTPVQQPKSSFVSRAAERQELNVFGARVFLAAGSAETGGTASMVTIICPPGCGAPLHRHEVTESFVVTKGSVTAYIDQVEHVLQPGDVAQIAPWAVHTIVNRTQEDAEMFAFGTPAGHEEFFKDADALMRSGNFNPETAKAVCQKHKIELLK